MAFTSTPTGEAGSSQAALPATTLTDVLTSASRQTQYITTIVVCNRDSGATTFRLALSPLGAAIDNSHYLYYDKALAANDSAVLEFAGLPISRTDVLRAYAGNDKVSIAVFTKENP